jgi:hypothetical protein
MDLFQLEEESETTPCALQVLTKAATATMRASGVSGSTDPSDKLRHLERVDLPADVYPLMKKIDAICRGTCEDTTLQDVPAGGKRVQALNSPPAICDRSRAIVRGLGTLLEEHGAGPEIVQTICQQIHLYLDDSPDEKIWVKRCKYMLCLPLAKYLDNELPPPPDKLFKLTGIGRKWVKNRLNAKNDANVHLWTSWLQAKRCTLNCSEDFINETYNDHFAALSRRDPLHLTRVSEAFNDDAFWSVLQVLRREVNEKIDRSYQADRVWMSPSKSACFEATRSRGGQLQALREQVFRTDKAFIQKVLPEFYQELCRDDRRTALERTEEITGLDQFYLKFFPTSVGKFFSARLAIEQTYDYLCWTDDLTAMYDCGRGPHGPEIVEIRQPCGWEEWSELADRMGRYDLNRPLKAAIQAVIEPLKVRVISKGECLPYFFEKHLQSVLHTKMREMPCFRLIGRPFCPTDLIDLNPRKPGYEWISVDYSQATDKLSWFFSNMILRFILQDRSEKEKISAFRVLGPHSLFYPQWDEEHARFGPPEYRGDQTNGQLMGSILSFPFLCLANLATYLLNMQDVQGGMSSEERLFRVLVNGDDMLYAAPKEKFATHREIARDLGLDMSIGKAYVHPSYANVNSTSITYDLRREFATPRQIDYLNLGLLFDSEVQKKKGSLGEVGGSSLLSGLNKLLDGCRNRRMGKSILSKFLSLHGDKIREETRIDLVYRRSVKPYFRNLFLPCSQGGMGILPPLGWRFKIKPFDRVIAGMLQPGGLRVATPNPVPGFLLRGVVEYQGPWLKPSGGEERMQILFSECQRSGSVRISRKMPIHCEWYPFAPNRSIRRDPARISTSGLLDWWYGVVRTKRPKTVSCVQSALPSNPWKLPMYGIGPIRANPLGEHRPYVADPKDCVSSGTGSGSATGIKSSVLSAGTLGASKAIIRVIVANRRFRDIRPAWRSVTEVYELKAKRLHGSAYQ